MKLPPHADSAGKLVLRLTLGGTMLLHGWSKVIGYPESIAGLGKMLTAHGLPTFFAYGAFVGEVLAPLLLVLGLFTRLSAALIAVNMVFAIWLAHAKDVFTLTEHGGWGIELQAFYLFVAVAIIFLGSGRFAVRPS
jgi:putative oxidoreductase